MPGAVAAEWESAAEQPQLVRGCVHVWRADLDGERARACAELVCEQERERAARIVGERERGRWLNSRGVLRDLLAGYLGADGRELRFGSEEHGKPALRGDARAGEVEISFNVSHSAAVGLYAFGDGRAIGVDVEMTQRDIDIERFAARVFGRAEADRLLSLPPESRRLELLRAWTRHEACAKCTGEGIGAGAGIGTHATAIQARRGFESVWVAQLDVGESAAAAVAAEGEPSALRLLRWGGHGA
jgi:4'-phosphopantetheinyl transferase